MVSISRFFRPSQKTPIYSEICAQNVYSEVRSFLYNAVGGKGLADSSGNMFFPEYYRVVFDTTGQRISLSFETPTSTWIFKTIAFSWDDALPACQKHSFYVSLSGTIQEISMRKNLQENIYNPSFGVTPDLASTGAINFILHEDPYQRVFFRLIVDKRVQNILFDKCLSLPSNPQQDCVLRSHQDK